MRVSRHRLDVADYRASPNRGGELDPRYLLIHYTATPSATSAVNWLTDRRSSASAHLVIDTDGEITQLVPFDRVAWHAGRSSWDGVSGLNSYAIGIELVNAGRLEMTEGGEWRAWFGRTVPMDQVLVAPHRSTGVVAGWPLYPEAQLMAAAEAGMVVSKAYGILDVLGHDDVSPGRKVDPGPAFPMGSFRSRVLGREDDQVPVYRPTTSLNIRAGAGASFEKVAPALTPSDRVVVLEEAGSWRRVMVHGEDVEGWVHGAYLVRA